MINFRKATLSDIPSMQALCQTEVDAGIILPRTDNEVATNIRSYLLAYDDKQITGYLALHLHTPFLGEIRSLLVAEAYRGDTIGTQLVKLALDEARSLGLKEVLALTYQKIFFERIGFYEIPKESLPEHKIWADCIKCKHFPVCNEIALIMPLS